MATMIKSSGCTGTERLRLSDSTVSDAEGYGSHVKNGVAKAYARIVKHKINVAKTPSRKLLKKFSLFIFHPFINLNASSKPQ
jgi:hypothetical protein